MKSIIVLLALFVCCASCAVQYHDVGIVPSKWDESLGSVLLEPKPAVAANNLVFVSNANNATAIVSVAHVAVLEFDNRVHSSIVQVIEDPFSSADVGFGSSLAISSDLSSLFIGASMTCNGAGAVLIYHREGVNGSYAYSGELQFPEPWQRGVNIGVGAFESSFSMTCQGNSLAVPAVLYSGGAGGVFMFERRNGSSSRDWQFSAFLDAPKELGSGAQCGASIAFDDDATLVTIGCPGAYGASGAALLHSAAGGSGWQRVNELRGGGAGSRLGAAVSLRASGETTWYAGAPGRSSDGLYGQVIESVARTPSAPFQLRSTIDGPTSPPFLPFGGTFYLLDSDDERLMLVVGGAARDDAAVYKRRSVTHPWHIADNAFSTTLGTSVVERPVQAITCDRSVLLIHGQVQPNIFRRFD
jgi:hypothetical protein